MQQELWRPNAYGNPEPRVSDEPLAKSLDPPAMSQTPKGYRRA